MWLHRCRVLGSCEQNSGIKKISTLVLSYQLEPGQFQPLQVSFKVKQAALQHNLTLLQRYYTLCQKFLRFISPKVFRVFVITV